MSRVKRTKEWWLAKARLEGNSEVAAGNCRIATARRAVGDTIAMTFTITWVFVSVLLACGIQAGEWVGGRK